MRAYLKNIWCYQVRQAAWFIKPGSPFLPVSYMWSVIVSAYHSLYIYLLEIRDGLLKDFPMWVSGHNWLAASQWSKCFGPHYQLIETLVASCFRFTSALRIWPIISDLVPDHFWHSFALAWCSDAETFSPEKYKMLYTISCQVFCTSNRWNKTCYFHLVGRNQHCYFYCCSVRAFYFHCNDCTGSHNQ